VEIHPGARGGVFVRRPDTSPINSSIDLVASMNGLTLAELAEFREVVEGRNAYWAARRGTPAELDELKALVEEIARLARDRSVPWSSLVTRDAAFHDKVAQLSNNRLSIAVLQGVMSGLQATLRRVPGVYRMRMVSELSAIYAAIRARNAALAETLMRKHIVGFQRVLTRRARAAPEDMGARRGRSSETPQ
jgi:DNA-binding FadR family transcriptional regulator